MKKFKETGDSRYIYQNELDKAYFQHDTVYGDFKDVTRRTTSDKTLFHLILLQIQKKMNINVELLQWFINFF